MAAKPVLRGEAFVEALRKRFVPSVKGPARVRAALATRLGCSALVLYNWQTRNQRVAASQVANIIGKAQRRAQQFSIRPIVEFFDLEAEETTSKRKMELFSSEIAKEHPYLRELKNELKRARGIYVFYDSRGKAIYVGKARDTSLWNEMKNVFNRDRQKSQCVKRVPHPFRRVKFKPGYVYPRKIVREEVQLHELSDHMSAYEVPQELIDILEALFIRAFANDLLNAKIEQFPTLRSKKRTVSDG